jgi:hypothetical protein
MSLWLVGLLAAATAGGGCVLAEGDASGEPGRGDELAALTCAEEYFLYVFDRQNEASHIGDIRDIRREAFFSLVETVSDLKSCGARVTFGGMASLLAYESGLRVGAYNTRCVENSYHRTESGCDAVPEAMYSYQFGLGAAHTSNLHPCKGGAWTQTRRDELLIALEAAGFAADPSIVTEEIASRFAAVCPGETPTAVDFYLLGAHDHFGIPRNDAGNFLDGHGTFPLFSPDVSLSITFSQLFSSCKDLTSDRAAIARFGGSDARYSTQSMQNTILKGYQDFAAAHCGR